MESAILCFSFLGYFICLYKFDSKLNQIEFIILNVLITIYVIYDWKCALLFLTYVNIMYKNSLFEHPV